MRARRPDRAGAARTGPPGDRAGWAWPERTTASTSGRDDAAGGPLIASTTPLGLPDDEVTWTVDGKGLVSQTGTSWSLDWWARTDARWYVPAHEPTVRQRLVGLAPVIETRMRASGGDITITHWAAPSSDGVPSLQIEIDNDGDDAVAVALALRPFTSGGPGFLGQIGLDAGRLSVHGDEVVRAGTRPREAVLSDGAGGDAAAVAFADAAGSVTDDVRRVRDPQGWASVAVIWPLAPRAGLRAEVRAVAVGTPPRRSGRGAAAPDGASRRVAGPEEVARAWTARVERVTRLELPESALATAVEVHRRRLLLSRPRQLERVDGALVAAALATMGCRDEAGAVLASWFDEQGRGGLLGADPTETAATLWALGVWAATGVDRGPLLAGAPVAVARSAEAVARAGRGGPSGALAGMWATAGLRAAAAVLACCGEDEAGRRVATWVAAAELAPDRSGADDETVVAGLLGVHLGIISARGPSATEARSAAAAMAGSGDGPVGAGPVGAGPVGAGSVGAGSVGVGSVGGSSGGLSPYLSVLLATSCVLAGENPGRALGGPLALAGPTWTWPGAVAAGGGVDPLAGVAWWALARAVLVDDGPHRDGHVGADGTLRPVVAVCSWLPPTWVGRDIEVHGLATRAGRLSWALRWHGARPALLWELEGNGVDVEVQAPGLDPAWSATGRRGEAMVGR